MKYIFNIFIALLSLPVFADSFVAKCQDFTGEHIDHVSGDTKPFRLNDATIYEFSFSREGSGSLKYVIDGTGVIEPQREDRWHELALVSKSSSYISATSFEGTEQILFSLYPKLSTAQIIWIMQPTKLKAEPATLLLKASCEFSNE